MPATRLHVSGQVHHGIRKCPWCSVYHEVANCGGYCCRSHQRKAYHVDTVVRRRASYSFPVAAVTGLPRLAESLGVLFPVFSDLSASESWLHAHASGRN